MALKVIVEGYDENQNKQPVFVDPDGKLRTGIVEYIKLIAQHNTDGVVVGTGTTTPTTYNTILCYPLPLHSNNVGDDYQESTLTLTASAGSTASRTGSVSATFVATLRNAIRRVRGDVIAIITYTYFTNNASATVTISSIDVEIGKIDTSSGTKTTIVSKSLTINRSTTNSAITESIAVIFGNLDFDIKEGERLYLTVTINYSFTVDATGSTAAITSTATVRIDHYRGTDDTHILLPVVM